MTSPVSATLDWIERARQTLRTSHLLFDRHASVEGAADRAFFAIFYAIRAVLAERFAIDVHAIKTHDGTEYFFYRDVVTPGLLDRSLAKVIHDARQLWRHAQWSSERLSREAVEQVLVRAEPFIDACERLVREVREQ